MTYSRDSIIDIIRILILIMIFYVVTFVKRLNILNQDNGIKYPHLKSVKLIFSDGSTYNNIKSLRNVSGFETWGRWTDGSPAIIEFKRPVSGYGEILLKTGCIGSDGLKYFEIIAGSALQKFVIRKCSTQIFQMKFHSDVGFTQLIIKPYFFVVPKDGKMSDDTRRLALSLYQLDINADVK